MSDLFNQIASKFNPESVSEFSAIPDADYKAEIKKAERRTGEAKSTGKPYDFVSVAYQIKDGPMNNRYVDGTFNLTTEKGITSFLKTLSILDLTCASSDKLDSAIESMIGKTCEIATQKYEYNGQTKYNVYINKADDKQTNLPF